MAQSLKAEDEAGTALALIDGEPLEKTTTAERVVIREVQPELADEYEYITNCV